MFQGSNQLLRAVQCGEGKFPRRLVEQSVAPLFVPQRQFIELLSRSQVGQDSNCTPVVSGATLLGAIGMFRRRVPVAAKMAFPTAGARPTRPVSPAPADGRSLRSTKTISISGVSLNRGSL